MKQVTIETIPLAEWGLIDTRPLIISGPCSAESREQLMQTARDIKKLTPEVQLFRAGIWKPRTRPGTFEGVGIEGLAWMRDVKREVGLKTTIEVSKGQHVYEALKHEIDVLWIGARTTVNPFSVAEIAEALKGVDIPILVKNPINPDLQLWIGAIERIHGAGITKLGAIHRGFSSTNNGKYRNSPMWRIPIELKRHLPNIPMICDPSHICGNREMLGSTAQRAYNLAMDGLMIETHFDPDNALSDQAQQVKPPHLKEVLAGLRLPRRNTNAEIVDELDEYRQEIDNADTEIIEALARRFAIVSKIAEYKKEHNMSILQVKRWKHLLQDKMDRGAEHQLDQGFVKDIYQKIHLHSIELQDEIIG